MPNTWEFAVLALFVVTLLIGVNSAYASDSATTVEPVTNESLTADIGNWVSVDASTAREFLDNETVTNSSAVELVEGTDYTWNTSNGSIKFSNTNRVDAGESMEIDYAYRRPTDATRLHARIFSIFGGLTGVLVLIVGAGAMYRLSNTGGL